MKHWEQTKAQLAQEKELLQKGCTLRELAELREKQGLKGEVARIDRFLPENRRAQSTINVFKL